MGEVAKLTEMLDSIPAYSGEPLTYVDAAIYVMTHSGFMTLHYRDITRWALKKNLIKTKSLTPQNTMAVALSKNKMFSQEGDGFYTYHGAGSNYLNIDDTGNDMDFVTEDDAEDGMEDDADDMDFVTEDDAEDGIEDESQEEKTDGLNFEKIAEEIAEEEQIAEKEQGVYNFSVTSNSIWACSKSKADKPYYKVIKIVEVKDSGVVFAGYAQWAWKGRPKNSKNSFMKFESLFTNYHKLSQKEITNLESSNPGEFSRFNFSVRALNYIRDRDIRNVLDLAYHLKITDFSDAPVMKAEFDKKFKMDAPAKVEQPASAKPAVSASLEDKVTQILDTVKQPVALEYDPATKSLKLVLESNAKLIEQLENLNKRMGYLEKLSEEHRSRLNSLPQIKSQLSTVITEELPQIKKQLTSLNLIWED